MNVSTFFLQGCSVPLPLCLSPLLSSPSYLPSSLCAPMFSCLRSPWLFPDWQWGSLIPLLIFNWWPSIRGTLLFSCRWRIFYYLHNILSAEVFKPYWHSYIYIRDCFNSNRLVWIDLHSHHISLTGMCSRISAMVKNHSHAIIKKVVSLPLGFVHFCRLSIFSSGSEPWWARWLQIPSSRRQAAGTTQRTPAKPYIISETCWETARLWSTT